MDDVKPLTYGCPAVHLSNDQEVSLWIDSPNGHSYRLDLSDGVKQGWITVETLNSGGYDRRIAIRNSKVQLYISTKSKTKIQH